MPRLNVGSLNFAPDLQHSDKWRRRGQPPSTRQPQSSRMTRDRQQPRVRAPPAVPPCSPFATIRGYIPTDCRACSWPVYPHVPPFLHTKLCRILPHRGRGPLWAAASATMRAKMGELLGTSPQPLRLQYVTVLPHLPEMGVQRRYQRGYSVKTAPPRGHTPPRPKGGHWGPIFGRGCLCRRRGPSSRPHAS